MSEEDGSQKRPRPESLSSSDAEDRRGRIIRRNIRHLNLRVLRCVSPPVGAVRNRLVDAIGSISSGSDSPGPDSPVAPPRVILLFTMIMMFV